MKACFPAPPQRSAKAPPARSRRSSSPGGPWTRLDAGPLHQVVDVLEVVVEGHAADAAVLGDVPDGNLVQGLFQQHMLQGFLQSLLCGVWHITAPPFRAAGSLPQWSPPQYESPAHWMNAIGSIEVLGIGPLVKPSAHIGDQGVIFQCRFVVGSDSFWAISS